MYVIIIFGLIGFFGSLHASSISQKGRYIEYCRKVSEECSEFGHFKRNPIYRCILEHTTEKQGTEYLHKILNKYPYLIQHFDKFRENDTIGDPILFSYGDYGIFSPTTLQYISILGDIRSKFGSTSHLKIAEIGGGYGGQCKILYDLDGFASYTIIDLAEPLNLTRKYLSFFKLDYVKLLPPDAIDMIGDIDLVISNFAFSEIDRDEQIQYLEKIMDRVPMGYLIINFIHEFFGIKPLMLNELIFYLSQSNREIILEREMPATGPYNVVVSWKPKKVS